MNPSGFYDVAQLVLNCVCDQMDALATDLEEYPGCPCLSYVSAGEPAIDCCVNGCEDNGMLTVHVENTYPSDVFPSPLGGFEPCKAQTWVAAIVITAARCAPPFSDNQGTPADMEELNDQAWLQAIDSYAVLTALGCCVVDDAVGHKRKRRVLVLGSTPLVSEGGCASVEIRALVEAGQVCSCPPVS